MDAGLWLCCRCEHGLAVDAANGMTRQIDGVGRLQSPLERVEGKGILQRRCSHCDRGGAFCRLFKVFRGEERGADFEHGRNLAT